MVARCFLRVGASMCFVKMSAGFWVTGFVFKSTSPAFTLSCTQRSATAKCLTFPNHFRLQIPIAAVAFEHTVREKVSPRSAQSDLSPMPFDAALQIPDSSASPLESATVVWVELQWYRRWVPRSTHPPDVDRLVRMQLAKSVSASTLSCDVASWKSNFHTSVGAM